MSLNEQPREQAQLSPAIFKKIEKSNLFCFCKNFFCLIIRQIGSIVSIFIYCIFLPVSALYMTLCIFGALLFLCYAYEPMLSNRAVVMLIYIHYSLYCPDFSTRSRRILRRTSRCELCNIVTVILILVKPLIVGTPNRPPPPICEVAL